MYHSILEEETNVIYLMICNVDSHCYRKRIVILAIPLFSVGSLTLKCRILFFSIVLEMHYEKAMKISIACVLLLWLNHNSSKVVIE